METAGEWLGQLIFFAAVAGVAHEAGRRGWTAGMVKKVRGWIIR